MTNTTSKKEYDRVYSARIRAARFQAGLCRDCGEPREDLSVTRCRDCGRRNANITAAYVRRLKGIRERIIPYTGVRCEWRNKRWKRPCGRAASRLLERSGNVLGEYCEAHVQYALRSFDVATDPTTQRQAVEPSKPKTSNSATALGVRTP